MSVGRRLLACLVAVVLPPLGVYMAHGRGRALIVVTLGYLAALALFWGLAALPGFGLYVGVTGLAVLICLWPAPATRGVRS